MEILKLFDISNEPSIRINQEPFRLDSLISLLKLDPIPSTNDNRILPYQIDNDNSGTSTDPCCTMYEHIGPSLPATFNEHDSLIEMDTDII